MFQVSFAQILLIDNTSQHHIFHDYAALFFQEGLLLSCHAQPLLILSIEKLLDCAGHKMYCNEYISNEDLLHLSI